MNIMLRPLLVALCALAASSPAQAQGWPERPIKFISSQAAGGGTDAIGRLVADQLAARLGQPIVYENRPGGGNVIGTQAAARSAPDGYTFFFASAAALVTDPHTYKSLPYDPVKDFTAISSIAEVSFMVLAHPSVPAKTLPELIAYAKAEPEKLAVATDGARRFSGMIAAWINKLAGTADLVRALHADDAGRAGRARRPRPARHPGGADRARAHRGRHAAPAGGDVGRAGWRTSPRWRRSPRPFRASISPAGGCSPPPPACRPRSSQRVNREMDAILKDPAVTGRMSNAGFISRGGGTIDETRAYVQAQHAAWGKLVQEIGLQPE